jgi:4-aminobutyrate aminotransferase-like enzyme
MLDILNQMIKKINTSEQSLVGEKIKTDPSIELLLSDLIDEVGAVNSELHTIRPPQQHLVKSAQKTMAHLGQLRGRPLYHNYIGTGAGRGPFVELIDGSVKLDLINGIGIHIMGHSHRRVMKAAVRGSLSDVIMQGNLQPNNEYWQLSEKLIQLASRNSQLRHVWFATCGTMANENALKLARQKNSPARMILAMKNAFAGRSTMMAEITDNPAYKQGLPEYNEVLRIPNHDKFDPQSAEKALKILKEHCAKHEKNISSFVFEPMLGEGGFQPVPREFYVPMLEFCKQQKIAVWADEVQTFARTGEFFGYETMEFSWPRRFTLKSIILNLV